MAGSEPSRRLHGQFDLEIELIGRKTTVFFGKKAQCLAHFVQNHYFRTFGINLRLRLLASSETIQNCLQINSTTGVLDNMNRMVGKTRRIQESNMTYIYCQYRPNANSRTNWYLHNFQILVVERQTWYLCFLWGWHLLFCVNTSETSSDLFVDKKKRQ